MGLRPASRSNRHNPAAKSKITEVPPTLNSLAEQTTAGEEAQVAGPVT